MLEKHAGLKLGNFDEFINVSGGFNISETSGDLAVAIAIASSLKEKSVEEGSGFIGEVSLAGELRPVSQIEKRVQEFRFSGFKRIYVSEGDVEKARGAGFDGEIIINDDLEWECPNCGNKNQTLMNVTRRTCGYLGENFWNVGKTKEIKSRVLHL